MSALARCAAGGWACEFRVVSKFRPSRATFKQRPELCLCLLRYPRYQDAFTSSARLTPYRLAWNSHLDRSEIGVLRQPQRLIDFAHGAAGKASFLASALGLEGAHFGTNHRGSRSEAGDGVVKNCLRHNGVSARHAHPCHRQCRDMGRVLASAAAQTRGTE